ncbi:hypothetical protein B0H21DRAFT_826355 [Amylocystis lapponica]|nr:hypothetical protein B0H21DRAFT_826355 [Amylocystis lapponica]
MSSAIAAPSTPAIAPREIGGHTLRARKPKPSVPQKKTKARGKKPTADPPVVPTVVLPVVPAAVLPAVPPEMANVPVPRPPTRWFRRGVLQPGKYRAQRVDAAPTTARSPSMTSARSGSRTAVESEVAVGGEEPDAAEVKPKPSAKALGKRKATVLDDIPEACGEAASQVPPAKRPRRRPAATPRPRVRKRT